MTDKNSKLIHFFKSSKPRSIKNIPPYDTLINLQTNYLRNRSFENALSVLTCLNDFEDLPFLYKYVLKNCFKELQTTKQTEQLSKIILNLYKSNICKKLCTVLIFNLYFKLRKYELSYNFLLITTNDKQKTIYYLYKCLLLLYKEDMQGSLESIRIAYPKYKNSIFLYFIINLINNRFIIDSKLNDKLIIVKNTIKKGLFNRMYSDLELIRNDCIYYNLWSICNTYLPLICFSNLIRRLYDLHSVDFKVDLKVVFENVDLDYESVMSLLCSVIDLNLVKGYLSVNKNVLVFSRKDPFPMSLNI